MKVPLGDMPIIGTPFEKVAIDLVGPLVMSDRKHRWILTMIDFATRYCITRTFRVEEIFAVFANLNFARNFPPVK